MGMMDMVRRSVLLSALHKATEGPAASLSFTADAVVSLPSVVAAISPVQSGSGDPSPDNIRPITGTTGLTLTHTDGDVSSTISVDWTDDAGTVYKGTLDLVSGVLTPTHKVIVLNGTETWSTYSGNWIRCYRYYSEYNLKGDSTSICSAFKNSGSTYQPANLAWGYKNDTNSVYLTFRQNGTTDLGSTTAWKAQLVDWADNGTPLTLMLAIRTQQTIQLTPNRIKPFLGQNSMSINTGDNLTVSYWKHN